MKPVVKWFPVFIAIASSFGENCDKSGAFLYEDLGCTPNYKNHNSCPFKYTCNYLEPPKDKCYFRGKAYTDGEKIDENLIVPPCQKGCFCSPTRSTKFTCAILDCPEWLGARILQPGCYRKYALDSCCSTGQVCGPFDNVEKCVVGEKEYKEGQTFTPPNSCLLCVCQKGFNGKFEEPFCKRRTCDVQIRSSDEVARSCAPLYGNKDETLCCPYGGWVCPEGNEQIKGEGKSEDSCKFGDKTLKVGQKFEKTNYRNNYGRTFDKVECECMIPPLLTCTHA